MTGTIQDCINWVQDQILAQVPQVQRAPHYPDDVRLTVPTAITVALNGRFTVESYQTLHTFFDLQIQVVVPRTDINMIMQFFDGAPQAIGNVIRGDITLGGNCLTYSDDVTFRFISGEVNGEKVVGYEFLVQGVKLDA